MQGAPAPEAPVEDEDAEAESLDLVAIAREQIRTFISQTIAGHDLADLVAAVFEARGFEVDVSSPGPDGGVDILLGSGPTGRESPRMAAQVKTGQADVNDYRALVGVRQNLQADFGLLVAWGGFRGKVRQEARQQYYGTLLVKTSAPACVGARARRPVTQGLNAN